MKKSYTISRVIGMFLIILGLISLLFVLWCILKVASIDDNNLKNEMLDFNIRQKVQKK